MPVYCVSFVIESNSTYQKRYDSFVSECKKDSEYWTDTTSFIVVKTSDSIDKFCQRIYLNSDFNAYMDLFLVIDPNSSDGRVKGTVKDKDLFTLLPKVKQI